MDGLDTHFIKLFHCAGMETWKVANVVIRLGGIAVIKELADDRVDAVRPRGNFGRRGHGEDAELRAKLKHQCGLQVLHSVREISKEEELAGINCLSGKHV